MACKPQPFLQFERLCCAVTAEGQNAKKKSGVKSNTRRQPCSLLRRALAKKLRSATLSPNRRVPGAAAKSGPGDRASEGRPFALSLSLPSLSLTLFFSLAGSLPRISPSLCLRCVSLHLFAYLHSRISPLSTFMYILWTTSPRPFVGLFRGYRQCKCDRCRLPLSRGRRRRRTVFAAKSLLT